jgi:hypothetical protein
VRTGPDIHRTGLPTRVALAPNSLHLELRDISSGELSDPFMQETIKRVPAQHVRVEIPRRQLNEVGPNAAPAGLIFHVARCGSTLASQLLKLHPGVVVYAEPLPFNEILVPPHKWDRAGLVGALRTLGAAFARHAARPYVLKFTSWNTLFCDVVTDAFPDTPWALCVRDPVEVCVSLLEHGPGWLRETGPAADVFRPVIDQTRVSRTREEYIARAYAALCAAPARLETGRGVFIRYEGLPEAVWDVLAPHFAIPVDDHLRRRMWDASSGYSKAPAGEVRTFVSDAARKKAAASPQLLESVRMHARPALEHLIRRFGNSS